MTQQQELLSVSDVARKISVQEKVVVRPRDITDLFYNRCIGEDKSLMVSGRRLIPADIVPMLISALRKRGVLPEKEGDTA